MPTFRIQSSGIPSHPYKVTWSDYALDFANHETLGDALEFIRKNPDIESLRLKEWPSEPIIDEDDEPEPIIVGAYGAD